MYVFNMKMSVLNGMKMLLIDKTLDVKNLLNNVFLKFRFVNLGKQYVLENRLPLAQHINMLMI